MTRLLLLLCLLPSLAWAEPPVLLGLYQEGGLSGGVTATQALDAWTGRPTTLLGTFLNEQEPPTSIGGLEWAWGSGYVPVVNFMTTVPTAAVAAGAIDGPLRAWADAFALWAQDGRRLMLLPFPEMNGNWVPYYGSPADFKAAWARFRGIVNTALTARGVPTSAVLWIFGPNGWSQPWDAFEAFYPGHDSVDAVGFSSFNFGGCPPWGFRSPLCA